MKDKKASSLRDEAEKRENQSLPEGQEEFSNMDTNMLVHELHVHQIELEIQNDELNSSLAKQMELTKKYNELFHFAPIGYFLLDRNSNIKEINLAGAQMLGFTKDYLTGKSFLTFIQPVHVNLFKTFFSRICLVDEKHRCEVKLISEEKQHLTAYLEGIRSIGDTGCLISAVDISDLKETEENLQKANRLLSDTLSLKEKLFSVIGHDLNGPLTHILLFFDMLQEEFPAVREEKFGKFLNEIVYDTEQALILLENLMAWSKLRSGNLDSNLSTLNIRSLVDDVCQIFSSAAARKEISLINLVDEDIQVSVNEFLVKTLLRNLITNGIKFSNTGGQVKIEAKVTERNIEFNTSDKGTGMSDDLIKNILSGEKTTSTFGTAHESGSGFGLILIKELVHTYGGELWIISRKMEGTSVHFTLPLKAKG